MLNAIFNYRSAMGVCVGVAALFTILLYQEAQSRSLSISFLDIGQGDSALIVTPSGRTMLVDTGPDGASVSEGIARHMPFYARTIDLIVLTHPDKDHIGGTLAVLKEYDVRGIIMPYAGKDIPVFQEILNTAKARNIPILFARWHERINLDSEVSLRVLWPPEGAENIFSASNDMSLVMKLTYKDDSFMLTGDMEARGEHVLSVFGVDLASDVLKVGHHGSSGSTSEDFLQKVSPKIAVISAGVNNRYGHPTAEVLRRLSSIKTLRTDKNGDITLVSQGNSF
ncbi:MAG: MBL fold metallo-hydrolase [Candidatus Spechtbacteria bacterium]|nr:MBL fold metallo-hydrolase [Candidatus Spechtbacteria bacterium]